MDNLKSLGPHLMIEVDERIDMPTEKRETLPMHIIVKEFQSYVDQPNQEPRTAALLANRIKILSEEKQKYYETSPYGGVKKFLSRFMNMFRFGRFKSSADLGLEFTKPYSYALNPKFICDQSTFNELLSPLEQQLDQTEEFDTAAFLRGAKGVSKEVLEKNEKILSDTTNFMRERAKAISDNKKISLEDAYKLLLGAIDKYDDVAIARRIKDKNFEIPSTFALRSALLLASIKDNGGLLSWMVYTKSGKPDAKFVWDWFDMWKNWVPEAQGAMAKFSEITLIKAKKLADVHTANRVVLLKGGFGAGKTRMTKKLIEEESTKGTSTTESSSREGLAAGVVAPDIGKRVVRRAMETVPHGIAHMQGSQIAFKLFDDMIQQVKGDVVYDSSLSFSDDVQKYLDKSLAAGKRMVIYDVARNDMARVLSVLKRSVGGDDPRIPPDFIINSALTDKKNRVACMNVILNAEIKKGQKTPEYHFVGTNAQGWDTQEVMVLTPHNIQKKHPEMIERLALEGIKIEVNEDTGDVTVKDIKAVTEQEYKDKFRLTVREVLEGIDPGTDLEGQVEYEKLHDTFANRKFTLTHCLKKSKDLFPKRLLLMLLKFLRKSKATKRKSRENRH
jgi:hypothetical protein